MQLISEDNYQSVLSQNYLLVQLPDKNQDVNRVHLFAKAKGK